MSFKNKSIVIGGGIAGISAAVELALNGVEVTLLEQSNRLGGRFNSYYDKYTSEIIDNGQHLMMDAYKHFIQMLNTLGTEHLLKEQSALKVVFISQSAKKHIFNTAFLPGKAGIIAGLLGLSGIKISSKILALKFINELLKDKLEYGGLSVRQLLIKNKQKEDFIERFWEPLVLAVLNASSDIAAASLLVNVLKRAFFSEGSSSKLLLPKNSLSELIAPFPDWLKKHGGRILLNTRVKEFIFENKKFKGIITSDGDIKEAETCISAVPPYALRKIRGFDISLNPKILEQYTYSPIISIYLWFDTDFFDVDFASLLGTNIQWIFNRRRIVESSEELLGKYPGHLALTISGAEKLIDLPNEELINIAIDEINNALPAANNAKLMHWKVIKEKSATFKATAELEPNRLLTSTNIPNFFLAGDWTATGLPATIEGAAQSGVDAAKFTIENLRGKQ